MNAQEIFNMLSALAYPLLWVSIILTSVYAQRFYRRRRSPELVGTSILLGFYTDGSEIIPLKTGVIADMRYTAIAFVENPNGLAETRTGLLYRVALPFESNVHLLGIPKINSAVSLQPRGTMEPVHLEGNYSKYFSLYAGKNMQSQVRYVLDPAGMVFILDFCRSHSWEIVGNELYFVQTGPNHADDTTTMEQDIERFVKEIAPTISRPLSDLAKKLQQPYDADNRTTFHCPICSEELVKQDHFQTCPQNHGLLVKYKALDKVSIKKILPYQLYPGQDTKRATQILCPHCDTAMHQQAYNGSKTYIDVCPKCPYRWFDSGEYHA